jgi:hypothetical protein
MTMDGADLRIARITRNQHSLGTRRQLQAADLTDRQVEHRQEDGRLKVVHRGVYALSGAPMTYEQRVLAACLATGGVASHRCAARLFGLRGFDHEQRIEISVQDRRATKLKEVIAHTSNLLETTFIGEIPVAMPAQVLLGLTQVAPKRAEGAVNDMLVKGLARLPGLVRFAERQSARGRGGIVELRKLLEEQVRAGAPTESWLEDQVVTFLRQRGFPEPVRGYPVGRRRLDIAWPQRLVNFEADGRLWHTSPSDRRRDATRDAALAAISWRTERIRWLQLHEDPDALEARLWRCYYGTAMAA